MNSPATLAFLRRTYRRGMKKTNKAPATMTIGGRKVSPLVAALLAQESDRLGITPAQVGDVAIPEPAPTTVQIAGLTVSIETGAALAKQADEKGTHVDAQISAVLEETAAALARRARRREEKRSLEGTWRYGPDAPSGGRDEDD